MPKRPEKKADAEGFVLVTVRFPPDVHADAKAAADADDRSLNTYVVRTVKAQAERDLEAIRGKKAAR